MGIRDDSAAFRFPRRDDPAAGVVARRDWMFGNCMEWADFEPDWVRDPFWSLRKDQPTESYPSSTLDCDGDPIRLLHLLPGKWQDPIRCFLEIVKLSDESIFEALSYTWGASNDQRTIVVGEQPRFPVTDNAFSALRRFRYEDRPRVLWIDAICIDQGYLSERMQQVRMMGKIYSGARRCLVWLGDASNSSNDVTIIEKNQGIPRDGIVDVALLKALDHIYWWAKPRWWERVWVVQETVLSRRVLVCFGSFQIDWGDFCWEVMHISNPEMPDWTGERAYPRKYITSHDYPIPESMIERFDTLAHLRTLFHCDGSIGPLRTARTRMLNAACGDPRDKVYGVLGMIDQRQAKLIDPDYTRPWVEVFARATYVCISEEQSFNILFLKDETNHDWTALPSWTVNFSNTTVFRWEHIETIGPVGWNSWTNADLTSEFRVTLSPDATRLTVCGYLFDSVISKSSLHRWKPYNSAGPELIDQLVDAIQDPRVRQAYLAKTPPERGGDRPLRFGGVDEQLLQSLRSGKRKSRIRATVMEAFSVAFHLWSQMAGVSTADEERESYNMSQSEREVVKYWEYAEATASDAALITTRSGFVGLAPNHAFLEDGLEVALLDKCKLPVLLRPKDHGCFSFVGFAYVHGIMYDELKVLGQDEGLVRRELVLC